MIFDWQSFDVHYSCMSDGRKQLSWVFINFCQVIFVPAIFALWQKPLRENFGSENGPVSKVYLTVVERNKPKCPSDHLPKVEKN